MSQIFRYPGGKSKNEKIYSGVFAFYVGDNGNIYLVNGIMLSPMP